MQKVLLVGVALAAACTPDCKKLKGEGNAWASVVCGGEGDTAPQAVVPKASACQPRAVKPALYKLLDGNDSTFAGLKSAMKDLSTMQCAVPQQRCASDEDCSVGTCGADGNCP